MYQSVCKRSTYEFHFFNWISKTNKLNNIPFCWNQVIVLKKKKSNTVAETMSRTGLVLRSVAITLPSAADSSGQVSSLRWASSRLLDNNRMWFKVCNTDGHVFSWFAVQGKNQDKGVRPLSPFVYDCLQRSNSFWNQNVFFFCM